MVHVETKDGKDTLVDTEFARCDASGTDSRWSKASRCVSFLRLRAMALGPGLPTLTQTGSLPCRSTACLWNLHQRCRGLGDAPGDSRAHFSRQARKTDETGERLLTPPFVFVPRGQSPTLAAHGMRATIENFLAAAQLSTAQAVTARGSRKKSSLWSLWAPDDDTAMTRQSFAESSFAELPAAPLSPVRRSVAAPAPGASNRRRPSTGAPSTLRTFLLLALVCLVSLASPSTVTAATTAPNAIRGDLAAALRGVAALAKAQHGGDLNALFQTYDVDGDETMEVSEVADLLTHAHVGVEAARPALADGLIESLDVLAPYDARLRPHEFRVAFETAGFGSADADCNANFCPKLAVGYDGAHGGGCCVAWESGWPKLQPPAVARCPTARVQWKVDHAAWTSLSAGWQRVFSPVLHAMGAPAAQWTGQWWCFTLRTCMVSQPWWVAALLSKWQRSMPMQVPAPARCRIENHRARQRQRQRRSCCRRRTRSPR